MAFTKITDTELNSRGATTLANQPAISPQALKEEFDAPAKEVVAPKFNNLIDELEASTAAASIGAVAPTGYTGSTIQALLNAIGEGVKTLEASQVGATPPTGQTGDNVQALIDNIYVAIENINSEISTLSGSAHTHSNKSLLDSYNQTNTDIADAVTKKHTHSNKSVLDKFTETESGKLSYDEKIIPATDNPDGFQTFIDNDLLTPTASGEEGDLVLVGTVGSSARDLYRCENDSWTKINLSNGSTPITYGTTDLTPGTSELATGAVYLVYE